MKKHPLYLIGLALVLIVTGCQKELSNEAGKNASHGSLQDDGTGDCLPKNVNGIYTAGTALVPATNTIVVQVDVTTAGSYVIYSDTVNGYYFRASGTFGTTGLNTVTLKGNGTPLAQGTNNFAIAYDTTVCFVSVDVLPAGSSGAATFTISCPNPAINGVYAVGTALNSTNTIVFNVNVTAVGTYNVTTTAIDGMTFSSGAGAFASTGTQTLTLTGTGTPASAGVFIVAGTAGSSTISVPITVSASSAVDYFPRTTNSNWSYEYNDDPTDSFYRVVIAPTKNALGNTYNIFMADDGSGLDSSGYYRKASTDYFEYFDAGNFIGFDNPLWAEYIFLKDAATGTTWNSQSFSGMVTPTNPPGSPQPLTIRFKYTVQKKDSSMVLTTSGSCVPATYNNVIVIREQYEQFAGSTWNDVTSIVGYGVSYYAKNIGLIKYERFVPNLDANSNFTGVYDLFDKQELKRHQIF